MDRKYAEIANAALERAKLDPKFDPNDPVALKEFVYRYLEPDPTTRQIRDSLADEYDVLPAGVTARGQTIIHVQEKVPTVYRCSYCGKGRKEGQPKFQVCSRCKQARYCSEACHKKDWSHHKKICKSIH